MNILIPDVSRVYHQFYLGSHNDSSLRDNLFNRLRKTNIDTKIILKDLKSIKNETEYENYVIEKFKNTKEFPDLANCYKNGRIDFPNSKG